MEDANPFDEKFTTKLTKDDLELDQFVTILNTNHGEMKYSEIGGKERPVGVTKNALESFKGEIFVVEALSFPYVMLQPISIKSNDSMTVDIRSAVLGEVSEQFVGAVMANNDSQQGPAPPFKGVADEIEKMQDSEDITDILDNYSD